MKTICKMISYVGLIVTVVPSMLVFSGMVELETHKVMMLIGMILWFITAPFWMNRQGA